MDTDLVLTLGILLLIMTVPSLLAAWVEGRAPRIGALMLLASSSMIVTALVARPSGYRFEEIPQVMLGVVARVWS
jgi:formate-dependent nitrite reductase membrane component NrfD